MDENPRLTVRPMSMDGIDKDVPDPVRSKSIVEMLYNLDTDCGDLWDMEPLLGFLYLRSRDSGADYEASLMEFSPLPDFGMAARKVERVHHALVMLGDMVRPFVKIDKAIVPPDLIAVVLRTEAWALMSAPNPDPAKKAEYDQASYDHTIHEHPERVEVRLWQAVDIDGIRYSMMMPRDGAPRHTAGADAFLGDVPNALHYFLDISRGHDTPEWRKWCEMYSYQDRE